MTQPKPQPDSVPKKDPYYPCDVNQFLNKCFNIQQPMHNSMYYSYVKTTTPIIPTRDTCKKCGTRSITQKHVKLKDERECLLKTCISCQYQWTERTSDNRGSYDLPTVEEALKA